MAPIPESARALLESNALAHLVTLALTASAGEQTNATAKEPVQQTGQQNAQSDPPRP
jgi:hypothetical protein